jgi:bacillithiol system protein YtxJ
MTWNHLSTENQLEQIIKDSFEQPIVLFKHSTRCSISTMAKSRLENANQPEGIMFYYLDLIQFRSISNLIAEKFAVHHESPQVLLIKNGECVYDESHSGIRMEEIVGQLN